MQIDVHPQLTGGNDKKALARLLEECSRLASPALTRMLVTEGPNAGLFSRKVSPAPQGLQLAEPSVRYSLISWIGLCSSGNEQRFRRRWQEKSFAKFSELLDAEPQRYTLGDLGLLLWLDRWNGNMWTECVIAQMHHRWRTERASAGSMELAWMLTGLTLGAEIDLAPSLRADVVQALAGCYVPTTSLFAFNAARRGVPWFPDYRTVLGSFASQVYPILALANYAAKNGDERATSMAVECADKVCSLQGPAGEWWWIYDTRDASIVCDYPIYSVHQDSMGPMALLAAYMLVPRAHYLGASIRGLEFLLNYHEPNTGCGFIDPATNLIWRAAVRLTNEDCADLPFGVSSAEMRRLRHAAWPRALQARSAANGGAAGYGILREARPYCSGWILFARASCRLQT